MPLRANDILFFNVHRKYLDTEINYGGFRGIFLLSAFLNANGYSAQAFAGTLTQGKNLIDKACLENKVSAIGLYCDFENVTENIFLSRYIKETYDLPVLIGGPQATALDEKFFRESKCDAVVRYEGELTMLELMNYFLEDVGSLEKILGIEYFSQGEIVKNHERPLIQNLDALPFVDENCYIEPKQYWQDLSLMTGRGCPFRCSFCHEGAHTRQVRFRSVENVLAEIDQYLEKWNSARPIYILFTDDTFTLSPSRLKKICEGLAERRKKHDFHFFCEGHIHTLYQYPEMIDYLVEAGCVRIQLGIESGNQKVIDAFGKHLKIEETIEVVRKCRDAGIWQIYGNIILAAAFFDRDAYDRDKKFAMDLLTLGRGNLELGVVTFWPLAETKITNNPADFGIEITDREFLTAVGDFPQTRTRDLDTFDIAEMERDLEKNLLEHMRKMIEQDEIPFETIMHWFKFKRTIWLAQLEQMPRLYTYYHLLFLREGYRSNEVDIESAKPMRVSALFRHMKKLSEDEIEVCDFKMRGIEREIFLLCTGKLSTLEILNRFSNLSLDDLKKFLHRIESNRLIIYQKY